MIGREVELKKSLELLKNNSNFLILGDSGIGKSTLIKEIKKNSDSDNMLTLPADTTKEALMSLVKQAHVLFGLKIDPNVLPPQTLARVNKTGVLRLSDIKRPILKLRISELTIIIINTLRSKNAVVLIDSLEVVPTTAKFITELMDVVQVVACIDTNNRRNLIKKILWKFNYTIELEALNGLDCQKIVKLESTDLYFSSQWIESYFYKHVSRESCGNPLSIMTMIRTVRTIDTITPAKIHDLTHEQGKRYIDMSWIILMFLIVTMALRYISRAIGNTEFYILSGVGSALIFGLLYMLRSFSKPKK